jgi:hypothetical protein
MYNQLVEWSGSAWSYTPLKYWPDRMEYGGNYGLVTFFAWNDGTGATISPDNVSGAPKLTYTVPNNHSEQEDLVADACIDKDVTGGPVNLAFNHILSRIGFTARLAEHYPGTTVKVTSLTVKYTANTVKSSGVYLFGDADHATGSWEPPTTDTYMTHAGDEVTPEDGVVLNNYDPTPLDTRLNANTAYLMLLPQTIPAGAVKIEVMWRVDNGDLQANTISLPTQVWLPGKAYDYNLAVSLTGITLDPVAVNPWDDNPNYKPYKITYNANNGTGTKIVYERVTNVAYQLLADGEFPLPSSILEGWNTHDDGSGTNYAPGESFVATIPGDVTLYAQWIGIIDLESNGAVVPPAVTYADNTFTISGNNRYFINGETEFNRVAVAEYVTCTVTMRVTTIDLGMTANACAFTVNKDANVTLVLQGENTLTSGATKAGVYVSTGAALTITGASTYDELTATAGSNGAGIGGNEATGAGTITIYGGKVTANGNGWGAGIGGGGTNSSGDGGDGGTLVIYGGEVYATGGTSGDAQSGGTAGIGGGCNYGGIRGAATNYYGPGAPAQGAQSWNGWDATGNTAYVTASGMGVAIDGVDYTPPTP